MLYNFNFFITKDGAPYGTSQSAAAYLTDVLQYRVTSDKPLLEYRVANELITNSETELSESERQYILNVILSLSIDNYFKGQLSHPLVQDVIDGVPQEVTLWSLRSVLRTKKLTDYHDATTAEAIGASVGLTAQQSVTMDLLAIVKHVISVLPTSTPEEIQNKIAIEEALEYGNFVLRQSPAVSFLQITLQLIDADVNIIFILADSINV